MTLTTFISSMITSNKTSCINLSSICNIFIHIKVYVCVDVKGKLNIALSSTKNSYDGDIHVWWAHIDLSIYLYEEII